MWGSHSVNETIKTHGSCLLVGIQWKFNEVHTKVARMIVELFRWDRKTELIINRFGFGKVNCISGNELMWKTTKMYCSINKNSEWNKTKKRNIKENIF